MSSSPPFPRHAWIVTLLCAAGFLAWTQLRRAAEVEFVTRAGAPEVVADAASPTGYAGGVRLLLAPGHNDESYQWIAQTQQMLATHAWRLRQVDYDNAPTGRVVLSPSPYRWWLAAVAWVDGKMSGRSPGLAVEHAALWADPALLGSFLVGGTLLVVWRVGPLAGAVFPFSLVVLYPLGGAFLPGSPDDNGLAILLGAGASLLLLIGLLRRETAPSSRRWLVAAGIAGGIGFWVNVSLVAPVVFGLGLGALFATWLGRRGGATPLAWRAWSGAGAVTIVLAWLVEYAPAHLDFSAARLSEVHPWYALAWLGLGEILARGERLMRKQASRADRVALGLAVLGVALIPALMAAKHAPGFLATDAFEDRLTGLGENTEAGNWAKWIVREGPSLRLLALVLPLGILGLALVQLVARATPAASRAGLALVLGPALVTLGFACGQLGWWNQTDALLLVLLVALCAGAEAAAGWRTRIIATLALLPALAVLAPWRVVTSEDQLTRPQREARVERDFAHWLAHRTAPDGAIALAPPNLTASLYFHGGLRGLGSPYRENAEGFRAAVRLAGATSADEAQALARQRKLTHVVIPSWDDFLDEYARLGADQPEHTLMGLLHNWLPPRWLKPVPYFLPNVPGFEDDRLLLFETTEVQDQATALSRLTEYFLDMSQVELASLAAQSLTASFSADLGAQVAIARASWARRDREAFGPQIAGIAQALGDGAGESLAWDRRVSLCLVLAEGGRTDAAREQVQRCLEEMSELDVRALSQVMLYRFLGLAKSYGLKIEDPALRAVAESLLPPQLRSRV